MDPVFFLLQWLNVRCMCYFFMGGGLLTLFKLDRLCKAFRKSINLMFFACFPTDQFHFPLQHCEDSDDQTSSLYNIGDNPVQVSTCSKIAHVLELFMWCARSPEHGEGLLDGLAVTPCCLTYDLLVRRKAVKATLVLLPLLGITYMLFFVNPGEDEISQIVFIYFNSFLESFQVGLIWQTVDNKTACLCGWLRPLLLET